MIPKLGTAAVLVVKRIRISPAWLPVWRGDAVGVYSLYVSTVSYCFVCKKTLLKYFLEKTSPKQKR